MSLKGKHILLGITGSIAAYKAAFLTRLLVKERAEVKVIMTEAAKSFIAPVTLSTLSKHAVLSDLVNPDSGDWNNHVELGLWADAVLIAPASANTLAKCANGFCDNLLTATYLSAKCPVFFAPAMDLDMYKHPSTQANLQKLQNYGNHIIPATHGELASGLVGEGRMAEPEDMVAFLEKFFRKSQLLTGKKVLITAGPTYEALDPVRFIGNHSSGKMGFAIAETFADYGAEVQLVSGPTHLQVLNKNISVVKVMSAQQMFEACEKFFAEADVVVLSAAVADYRPEVVAEQKIKKKETDFELDLVKTIDIAATLGKEKKKHQLMVGFALETENEFANASHKLETKNLDMIVLNSLRDAGATFGHDTNKITIIERNGKTTNFDLKSKTAVAEDIVQVVIEKLQEK
ncbi:MAG: bifunctional phosphopantothenoylcysteine decarboxylase/phosphopantothenate--cysteine ligase CoaBC [Verrucomicrobia bacterium]|nr:bifunctional phosphopantothenoylcysteine decarboxylase/phosphopantothenate--cysteine ligase CoaBC [Cytophagales bacterium]